jgi:GAF domain-containing protein
MVPFTYRRISNEVIDELFNRLSLGGSLILLGSRYVGKRHVMHRLRNRLEEAKLAPVVQLKFLAEPAITSKARVHELLEQAVEQALQQAGSQTLELFEALADRVDDPLDRLITAQEKSPSFGTKPIFLIVSNIDSLAHHLANEFVRVVRKHIENGHIIAILSGEDDLQYLVQSGGFPCGHPYVLQAYEREEFRDYLIKYAGKMNLKFESSEEAANELWRLTGGNIYTMRMILWALVQSRALDNSSSDRPIKLNEIPDSLNLIGIPGVYGTHVFRHGTQLIERDPECWQVLDSLLNSAPDSAPVKVGITESTPTRLEMAGMAIREIYPNVAYLKFASPLHERFIRQHYGNRRFGDLYAVAAKWDKAFQFYGRLNPEETIRPLGISDRGEVEAAIASLCASFFLQSTKSGNAGQSITEMKAQFANGARFLLGFSEVSFWRYDAWRRGPGWQMIPPEQFLPSDEKQKFIRNSLPKYPKSDATWQFEAPWNQQALVRFLPALREDQRIAVVISEFGRGTVISRERAKIAARVLELFAEAYAHVNTVDGLEIRLKVRDRHVETMNSIFNALGSDVRNVGQVLERAAKGLRELEYKRAFFSLVDPEEQRIQGFLDDNDSDPRVDLAELIDLPLRDHDADLQTLVIHERQPYRIADAAKDGRVHPELIAHGNIEAFALVPILNSTHKAIGTIHVERKDGSVPSEDEVKDLMFFGRQLAIAIEQSERVNLLQSSLDRIPEPIVIVDRAERGRYANRPAASLLDISEGWRKPAIEQRRFADEVGGSNAELPYQLHQSLISGNRLVSHFKGIGNQPEYRGAALTDIIEDWRGKTSGGLLHVQNFNYFHRIFLAARLIGQAQDTASALGCMLQVAEELLGPNNWGRLYLSDNEDNPEHLISKLSFGYADPDQERAFSEGKTVLHRDTPGGIDWLVFDLRKPVVFCWKDDLRPNDQYVTRYGLQAVNAPNPMQPPEIQKSPGDFWIDFPLMTPKKILGKLCFQCGEDLLPEDFELLTLLSEVIVGLFDAFVVRAELLSNREELIMASSAQKTVETIVHNLCTRFANLGPLATRYWLLEKRYPQVKELKTLNDHFFHVVDETQTTAKRAKEMLGPINPQWSNFELPAHMRCVLGSALPDDGWTVEAPTEFCVTADAHLLEMAILEMVQNSKDAAVPERELHVTLKMELDDSEFVKITYRDTGRGIPDEFSKTVFDELFSFRPGQNIGTGLGLAFVRRVFEAHGGFIFTGIASQGAEFVSAIRKSNVYSETKEERDVSHTYS